ncbi:MAG TPA: histidine kinase [Pyrinomonadaceae bacterium]|nr:histidine kinase [Pyrinomonadaceae bacterium]
MKVFALDKFKARLSSFWVLQLIGWALYGVLIYVTFLTVVSPSGRFSLLQVKISRTVAGFLLTSAMRPIYKHMGRDRSVPVIALLILITSFAFGSLWPFGEQIGLWLMNRPPSGFRIDWASYPVEVLDYSFTLVGWSALYFGIKYWRQWQAEHERTLQAEALANHAQLDMLRYQLNPHFLFNALNSIRASIDEDSQRAKRMVTEFSEFLRYSLLNDNSALVELREEVEAIKNYLAIEKIRFEDKLDVTFELEPAAEKCRVPGFLIHPLVENAVKHGMTNNSEPLKICIGARLRDGCLVVEVANTGRLDTQKPQTNGAGIGLRNVRERLAKLYPDKSSFSLRQDGKWIRATIEMEM